MKMLPSLCIVGMTVFAFNLEAAPPKKPAPKKAEQPEKIDPKALFTKFDENKDGSLSKTELSALLKSLKRNSVSVKAGGFEKFDANGDKKMDLQELTKLLESNK